MKRTLPIGLVLGLCCLGRLAAAQEAPSVASAPVASPSTPSEPGTTEALLATEADRAAQEGDLAAAEVLYRRVLDARRRASATGNHGWLLSRLAVAQTCQRPEAGCTAAELEAAFVSRPPRSVETHAEPQAAPVTSDVASLAARPEPSARPERGPGIEAADRREQPGAEGLPAPLEVESTVPARERTFYLEAAAVMGLVWIEPGLAADSPRPEGYGEDSPWVDCDGRGEACSVRVQSAGFAFHPALRVAAGVRVAGPFWLGASVRIQPDAGQGVLAGWLPELNARARFEWDALSLAPMIAVGLGQIQARPPQQENLAPYTRSGLAWLSVGMAGSYDIESGVELFVEVIPRLSLPDVVFGLDAGAGLRIRG